MVVKDSPIVSGDACLNFIKLNYLLSSVNELHVFWNHIMELSQRRFTTTVNSQKYYSITEVL